VGNVELVQRYLEAIEAGATGERLETFFTPDVEQVEFPNRLVPTGARRDLASILEAAERGRAVVRSQHFEVHAIVESGATAAAEATWTAVLAVPVGSIPAGGEMRARFAMFFELRDGRIARQRNYDCFDPF
jgi:ketosteroid isomerase-like protein